MLEVNKFYNADCLEILPKIDDESIDLIVTDCPYKIVAGGISIERSGKECGGILSHRIISDGCKLSNKWLPKNNKQMVSCSKNGTMFDFNNITFEKWLPEIYRVLKPNSHCYIMINGRNLSKLQVEAEKVGFIYQNLLIWNKGNATPNLYYMQNCEFILMLRKGGAKRINNLGSKTLISIPNIIGKKIHPTEKPITLFEHLIDNSSKIGDIVLDMFAGSCPLAVACHNLKRKFICIDIDEDFIKVGKERYKKEIEQLKLF